jgi:hypothetical protein
MLPRVIYLMRNGNGVGRFGAGITALGFLRATMKFYMLRELLLLLVLVAVSVLILLLFVIAAFLLQEASRRTASWLHSSFVRLARLRHHHSGSQQPKVSAKVVHPEIAGTVWKTATSGPKDL